jgi:hypothetical protein
MVQALRQGGIGYCHLFSVCHQSQDLMHQAMSQKKQEIQGVSFYYVISELGERLLGR